MELMELINNDENREGSNLKNNEIKEEKVLGITWKLKEDTFVLGVSDIFEKTKDIVVTKRMVLKVIASVYDPIWVITTHCY